jgi:hypothetical protein
MYWLTKKPRAPYENHRKNYLEKKEIKKKRNSLDYQVRKKNKKKDDVK